jgi:phage baseplate assembly protein V
MGIERLLLPLQRRIMLMVSRVVIAAVNDSLKLQAVKMSLLDGEVADTVERFQQYGLTSNPKTGAEGIAVFVGGNRDHGVVIAVDDRRYRLKNLAEGEVAIYTDEGDKIHLKRGRKIEITAGASAAPGTINIKADGTGSKITVVADAIELGEGALQKILNGEAFQTLFNSHTHTGGFVSPTTPPVIPSTAVELSTVVKAAP